MSNHNVPIYVLHSRVVTQHFPQGAWVGVQRIVKRSLLSSRKKKGVEQHWKIILHHLTKLHAFMANIANVLRIIEKRCNAF